MEKTTPEFDGVPVLYNFTCSYNKESKRVDYPVGRFTNDIETVLLHSWGYITGNEDLFYLG